MLEFGIVYFAETAPENMQHIYRRTYVEGYWRTYVEVWFQ